ncbi:uncharacterized protein LOC107045171 [Diachasma alloeum]|uniref:uncharacterized protein LOC107045171 n=1 Tax=Diachasma alloeum TaxID=454923 RepID=UPI000738401C|nr:uncharacterized protein LOC107045171 [Diachasma alloeum]
MAFRRFQSLERKFVRDPELCKAYSDTIDEYMELTYLSEVRDPSNTGFYLLHHAVIKKDSVKTKVRVVYDGSAKTTTDISLNETLLVGPKLQQDIFWQVLHFRTHLYTLTGDIEKMFLQFGVRKEDRRYQRIMWRNSHGKVAIYELNNVTFGLSFSPYQAVQCLQQLAEDEAHHFPVAARILKQNMYVDDLLCGFNSIREAKQAREEITQLLARGGLNIKHWASNDPRLLRGLPPDSIHQKLQLNDGSTLKTLGVYWDSQSDSISYTVQPVPVVERVTKRIVMSEIAKIYDPLGLLGPVVLSAKMIIQKLWNAKVNWDESVPEHIHTEWTNLCSQLPLLNDVHFPRKICQENGKQLQIHGFRDASTTGYGACIYVCSIDIQGNVQCRLFCAKSKVAPVKYVSVARLELCGALLLSRLYQSIKDTINIPIEKIIFWSASMITLHWISKSSNLFKTFVANRVAEIQSSTEGGEWRHVPGESNPADALSRDQMPADFITNELWKVGPQWLSGPEVKWPTSKLTEPIEDPEAKRVTCMSATINDFTLLERYHSIHKLKRVIAYLLRFKISNRKFKGPIQLEELIKAEQVIMRLVQRNAFPSELRQLSEKKEVDRKSKLSKLNPFLDSHGIIRVGGRLQAADIPYSQKHPVVLPKKEFVSELIIRDMHREQAHAGA